MKKITINTLVVAAAFALMSNTGCNPTALNGPDTLDTNPYECIDTGANHIDPTMYRGTIKHQVAHLNEYATVVAQAQAGYKYWLIPVTSIVNAPVGHPWRGLADRVITYNKETLTWIADPIECCGYYDNPEAGNPNSYATIFYDCRSTNRFVTNYKILH